MTSESLRVEILRVLAMHTNGISLEGMLSCINTPPKILKEALDKIKGVTYSNDKYSYKAG